MKTYLDRPMRRSDFLKFGLAVAGTLFLRPGSRWEGSRRAEAAEGTPGESTATFHVA